MWRQWDRELDAFNAANAEARELLELTQFIRPLRDTNFFWGVY